MLKINIFVKNVTLKSKNCKHLKKMKISEIVLLALKSWLIDEAEMETKPNIVECTQADEKEGEQRVQTVHMSV